MVTLRRRFHYTSRKIQDRSTYEPPTTKGTLWALAAVTTSSGLPLLFVYTHRSADPFAWRSWLLVFQILTMLPIFFVVPSGNEQWRESARRLLSYWGTGGEPLRVRTPLDLLRAPAVWMAVSLAFDLAFWVWAATLIDPLVVTIIFQLMLIGMVWLAARLGRKFSNAEQTSPHCHGQDALDADDPLLRGRRPGHLVRDRRGRRP